MLVDYFGSRIIDTSLLIQAMKIRGYLTQCTGQCGATIRLEKPAQWTCDNCKAGR